MVALWCAIQASCTSGEDLAPVAELPLADEVVQEDSGGDGGRGVTTRPVDRVNTLGGTEMSGRLSRGNVLPLVARPFAFSSWAPQSHLHQSGQADYAWWFHSSDPAFYGIRCTHEPSPWIGDWGFFRVGPHIRVDSTKGGGSSPWLKRMLYNAKKASWKPYLFHTNATFHRGDGGGGRDIAGRCAAVSVEVRSAMHRMV